MENNKEQLLRQLRRGAKGLEKFIPLFLVLISVFFLFACAPPPTTGAEAGGPMEPRSFIFGTIQFFCFALIVYYLLVLSPARTKEENHNKFIKELKKNDEVITSSGFFARVVGVKPEYITLELASNVRVKVEPQHVRPPKKKETDSGAGAEKRKGKK